MQEIKTLESSTPLPWYKEGLRFKCTECGKCCTGPTGFVWLSEEEIINLANYLSIPVDLFKRKYTKLREKRYALTTIKDQDHACVFLNNKKCSVYQVRPQQCRTYPWWKENLNTKESWDEAAKSCEGINDEAQLISYEAIIEQLETMRLPC